MNKLQNKTILILRSQEDMESTAQKVSARGAIPIACPVLNMRLPDDTHALDQAIHQLNSFDWIFFTSGTSVRFFHQRMVDLGINSLPDSVQCAAIGTATQDKIIALGWTVNFVALESTGEGFINEFAQQHQVIGKKFLLPLSHIARKALPDGLRQLGGDVTEVTAYVNEPVTDLPVDIQEKLNAAKIDWVLFTSSSTVENFYAALRKSGCDAAFKVASIGPKTTQTLLDLGIEPDVEASVYTIEGLLDGMVEKE